MFPSNCASVFYYQVLHIFLLAILYARICSKVFKLSSLRYTYAWYTGNTVSFVIKYMNVFCSLGEIHCIMTTFYTSYIICRFWVNDNIIVNVLNFFFRFLCSLLWFVSQLTSILVPLSPKSYTGTNLIKLIW